MVMKHVTTGLRAVWDFVAFSYEAQVVAESGHSLDHPVRQTVDRSEWGISDWLSAGYGSHRSQIQDLDA